jgi:ATP/maltotriose-dependent transcriptional regulator MalT
VLRVQLSGPHAASASELKERMEAERAGLPFLVLRDAEGAQRIIRLQTQAATVTFGRGAECDVTLDWDEQVSRVHAELVRVGAHWTLSDGGLSRNGSYLNGERIVERRRLGDGDTMRFGHTAVLFRLPASAVTARTTVLAQELPGPADLSNAQRAVLRALCRPFAGGSSYARPATNPEIAEELVLSLEAVKGHLRLLFAKFGVTQLPQNEKRLRLAERALTTGAVNLADLRGDRT